MQYEFTPGRIGILAWFAAIQCLRNPLNVWLQLLDAACVNVRSGREVAEGCLRCYRLCDTALPNVYNVTNIGSTSLSGTKLAPC